MGLQPTNGVLIGSYLAKIVSNYFGLESQSDSFDELDSSVPLNKVTTLEKAKDVSKAIFKGFAKRFVYCSITLGPTLAERVWDKFALISLPKRIFYSMIINGSLSTYHFGKHIYYTRVRKQSTNRYDSISLALQFFSVCLIESLFLRYCPDEPFYYIVLTEGVLNATFPIELKKTMEKIYDVFAALETNLFKKISWKLPVAQISMFEDDDFVDNKEDDSKNLATSEPPVHPQMVDDVVQVKQHIIRKNKYSQPDASDRLRGMNNIEVQTDPRDREGGMGGIEVQTDSPPSLLEKDMQTDPRLPEGSVGGIGTQTDARDRQDSIGDLGVQTDPPLSLLEKDIQTDPRLQDGSVGGIGTQTDARDRQSGVGGIEVQTDPSPPTSQPPPAKPEAIDKGTQTDPIESPPPNPQPKKVWTRPKAPTPEEAEALMEKHNRLVRERGAQKEAQQKTVQNFDEILAASYFDET